MAALAETPLTVVSVKTLNDAVPGAPVVAAACARIRDGAVSETFSILVNPQAVIPEEFTRLCGIYPADVLECPTLETALPEIAAFVGRDMILWTAHPRRLNAVHRFFRLTQPRDRELFLPVMVEKALPHLSRHNLATLATHFGLGGDDLIRAEGMAEAGARIYLRLVAELAAGGDAPVRDMADLLAWYPGHAHKRAVRRKDLPFDRDRLREYPTRPGVYFMKNRLGEILYIGKAKNLRSRLRSYFQDPRRLPPPKIAAMMKQVAMIDVSVVGSELEALLLEARLIKLHQPFFNQKIKHYKGMVFLRVSMGDDYPRVSSAVEMDDPQSVYLGPFTGKVGLEYRMDTMNRVFRLRSCGDHQFAEHREHPCLQYELNLCSGPCAGMISRADYRAQVEDFLRYVREEPCHTVDLLLTRRDAYAEALQFEKAAAIQARLDQLEELKLRSANMIQAVQLHHCLIILPGAEAGTFRLLGVLQGQPCVWHPFDPAMHGPADLERLIRRLWEDMRALQEDNRPGAVPKALYEEARLLNQWLENRDPGEGAVVFLDPRDWQSAVDEAMDHLYGNAASPLAETDLPAAYL